MIQFNAVLQRGAEVFSFFLFLFLRLRFCVQLSVICCKYELMEGDVLSHLEDLKLAQNIPKWKEALSYRCSTGLKRFEPVIRPVFSSEIPPSDLVVKICEDERATLLSKKGGKYYYHF